MRMLTEIEITHDTKYGKIKSWFEQNMKELPKTLEGQGKYYLDLPWTVRQYIEQVDYELIKQGSKINRSKPARAAKGNLVTIFQSLKDPTAWNLALPKTPEEKRERTQARRKFYNQNKSK